MCSPVPWLAGCGLQQKARLEQERSELGRLQREATRAAEELARRQKEKESVLERAREDLKREAADYEEQVGGGA